MENAKKPTISKWRITNRLTDRLVAAGFTAVPVTLLEHYSELGISMGEAMFLIQLMSYKWSSKNPFPKYGKIAQRMGVSEAAVRGYARNLEKHGFLRRVAHPGTSNEFDLTPLFLKLESLLPPAKTVS